MRCKLQHSIPNPAPNALARAFRTNKVFCNRLCLAGSCRVAIDLGTGSLGVTVEKTTLGLAVNEIVGVRQRGLRHATEALAVVGLALLLVGGDVEGDEEDQVGGKDANSRESSKLLACALAIVWHPLEIGGSEVGVRGEVDKAWTILVILTTLTWFVVGRLCLPRSMMN